MLNFNLFTSGLLVNLSFELSINSSLNNDAEILISRIKIERNINTVTIPVNIKLIPEIIKSLITSQLFYMFFKRRVYLKYIISFYIYENIIQYNN